MKQKIFTFIILTILSVNITLSQTYPKSSYQLSSDGKTLEKWIGSESIIDFRKASSLSGVTRINVLAFKNNQIIKKVILPEGLETIDANTFNNCSNLEECVLTSTSIKKLPNNLFLSCGNLKKLKISLSGLTEIGENVFNGCRSLETINLPNTIETIGDAAFTNSGLVSFSFPSKLKLIGAHAFEDCNKLKNVSPIPEGVTVIPSFLFNRCKKLEDIKIPNTLTKIKEKAFAETKSLKIKFPFQDGLIHLGNGAFTGSAIEEAILPNSVKEIGDEVFSLCKNLKKTKFTTHSEVTAIPKKMYFKCPLQNLDLKDYPNVEVIKMGALRLDYTNTSLFSDHTLDLRGTSIKRIDSYAFYNSKVKKLILPKSISSAFLNYGNFLNLEEIEVESGNKKFVTENGVLFTKGKRYLCCYPCGKTNPTYSIPPECRKIGWFAFNNCKNLTELNIPDAIVQIFPAAFQNANFKKIRLPKNLKSLRSKIFKGCRNLEQVIISKKITEIEGEVFANCPKLTNVKVEAGNPYYKSIDGVLFKINSTGEPKELIFYPLAKTDEEYTVPNTVTQVASGAFLINKNIKKVILPNGIHKIEPVTFYGCKNLETVHFPVGLIFIGGSAFGQTPKLTNLENFPKSIEPEDTHKYGAMSSSAFKQSGFTTFAIPKGVKTIGGFSLFFCKRLKQLSIPSSVTKINSKAFAFSYNIKEVECKNPIPPELVDNNAFRGVHIDKAVLYVPIGSKERYKTSPYQWKDFGKIIEKDFWKSKIWFQPTAAKNTDIKFEITGTKKGSLQIDWGDGTVAAGASNEYKIKTTAKVINGTLNGIPYGIPKVTTVRIAENQNNLIKRIHLRHNKIVQFSSMECPSLEELNLDETEVVFWDISKNLKLKSLSCKSNKLITLGNIKKNTLLEELYAQNNLLEDLDVSKQPALKKLNLSNNRLKEVLLNSLSIFEEVDLSYNNLKISTLPIITGTYIYSPQQRYQFKANAYFTEIEIDLSNENKTTTYVWKNAETGSILVEGVNYIKKSDGVFEFKTAYPNGVYCEMTTPVFPNLKSYTEKDEKKIIDKTYRSRTIAILQNPKLSIVYDQSSYCPVGKTQPKLKKESPSVTINGNFACDDSNLVINTTNGEIDLEASKAGEYIIKYIVFPSGAYVDTKVLIHEKPNFNDTFDETTMCKGSKMQIIGSGTGAFSDTYLSSIETVATVGTGGIITAIDAGITQITYTDNHGCKASKELEVLAPEFIDTNTAVCIGNIIIVEGSCNPAATNPYESSDTFIATVTNSGEVFGVQAGVVTITYTNEKGYTATKTVTVNAKPSKPKLFYIRN